MPCAGVAASRRPASVEPRAAARADEPWESLAGTACASEVRSDNEWTGWPPDKEPAGLDMPRRKQSKPRSVKSK